MDRPIGPTKPGWQCAIASNSSKLAMVKGLSTSGSLAALISFNSLEYHFLKVCKTLSI